MTRKRDLPAVPPALADVAFVDAPTCAAAAGLSISSWHDLVREGVAPAPAFRAPRCTRWRIADVRTWLIERAVAGGTLGQSEVTSVGAGRVADANQAKHRNAAQRVEA